MSATTVPYSPGLAGVIAGETAIASTKDELLYRGYPIEQLADHSTFEEVAYLLLEGNLPTRAALAEFRAELTARRNVPDELWKMVRLLPAGSNMMDVLRTSISFLGSFSSGDPKAQALDIIAKTPTVVAGAWRVIAGDGAPIEPAHELSHAGNFFHMLRGKCPPPADLHAFAVSLILYADHEFNASTFSARVTVSTLSDIWSGVTSAIGTLKGPLHGGANEEAMKMLLEVGDPARAEAYIMDKLNHKQLVMGFGHRVYKNGDQRARILKELMEQLSERWGEPRWAQISQTIETVMEREKHLFPNVDFACGPTYYLLGIPMELYTPIFVMARVVGWTSHILEQLQHNRIIRPSSLYTGVARREYVSISHR